MATFFDDAKLGFWSNVSNGVYGTLTGDVTRSGNTVTLSNMRLSIWSSYTSYGSGDFSITVNGAETGLWLEPSGTDFGTHSLNATSFTVSTSDTSRTVYWSTSDGESGSFVVYFPSGYVAPATPTVVIASKGSSSMGVSFGVTSFGVPASGTVYLYGGVGSSPSTIQTTQLSSKTSTGTTIFDHSGLVANQSYGYRARAYNGQLWSNYSDYVFGVTMPKGPSISVNGVDRDQIVIGYEVESDGGYWSKLLQYSIDNGSTWVNAAVFPTGNAASGTFVISGLTPNTTYNIRTRLTTQAGSTEAASVPITTKAPLYGSVNGIAKAIDLLYGSVNGASKRIIKLYGSKNGVTKRIF